jgi:hypothetical protein
LKVWLVALAMLALPSVVQAFPAYELVAPVEGQSLTPSPWGTQVAFEMRFPSGQTPHTEVSRSPALGQDGTLANDYVVGGMFWNESDAEPGTYRTGITLYGEGAYYFQTAVGSQLLGDFSTSPVHSFQLVAPVVDRPPPVVKDPVAPAGQSLAAQARCRSALAAQGRARGVFNRARNALRAKRTKTHKLKVQRAKRRLRIAQAEFRSAC